ncbi:hypothetical protein [Clostridium sp.]|uniref:hypothetical protein n=1 Tax=Clostridium sp. TaxID=1506 RepID=UPI00261D2EF2|nr:hypothetical protein [Clostridium sp.]
MASSSDKQMLDLASIFFGEILQPMIYNISIKKIILECKNDKIREEVTRGSYKEL